MPGACNNPEHILLFCTISLSVLLPHPSLPLFLSLCLFVFIPCPVLNRRPACRVVVAPKPTSTGFVYTPRHEGATVLLNAARGVNAKYELDTATVCLVYGSAASRQGKAKGDVQQALETRLMRLALHSSPRRLTANLF